MALVDWILERIDTLVLWLVPPSLLGAFFGDAFRKDLLTPRQRLAAFGLAVAISPLAGMAAGKEFPQGQGGYPDLVDVLSDLADPEFEYGGKTTKYFGGPKNEFQERMRTDTRENPILQRIRLKEHQYSDHSEAIRRKFEYMLKNDGRIHHMHQTRKFRQRRLPAKWGPAGPTITITSLPDDFVHYELARSLSVRECARIQTFPDWYEFRGPRTTGGLRRAGNPMQGLFGRALPKYTQIANAVPPDLARAIGQHLAGILLARR